ncbi:hypothetical protein [Pectinatus frisingensis]|uniref:hypothetical protein n=1 Tax=Pectinatus frisingensis TaxID=865 RepID=UPI003D803169
MTPEEQGNVVSDAAQSAQGENQNTQGVADPGQAGATDPAAETDIDRMKAAVNQLKAAGEDLFKDQIAQLEEKIEAAEKAAAADVQATEQTIIQKYGQVIAHAVEICILAVILYKVF